MATAIEFNHVGKQYRLGLVSTGTISHDLNRWWQTAILRREDPYLKIGSVNDRTAKADSDYVWALRDIDFKVEQGDVVGIIGKNGAGKSTLLKLLSKVTGPTVGTIRARGRIASLLEVGTGFHSEMTGRENIFMNGAILGMTKAEIAAKLDEIVDFSGCERYLDTPVKRYSSGMMVRLGFAVAAHLDPEILVVDEVLAVGDAEFQKKAIGKMQDVSKGEGRTVLFVSHNMGSVRQLCNTGLLLENGMVKYRGGIDDTIAEYQKSVTAYGILDNPNTINEKVSLVRFDILDENNQSIDVAFPNHSIAIEIDVVNNTGAEIDKIDEFTVSIESLFGEGYVVLNNVQLGRKITLKPGINTVRFDIPNLPLNSGQYRVGLWVSDANGKLCSTEVARILTMDATTFYGTGKVHFNTRFLLNYEMQINN